MILTDEQIIEALAKGAIKISPFDEKRVQPASYDCTVGKEGGTTSQKAIIDIEENGHLKIESGDFAVVTLCEKIELDAWHVGHFGLMSRWARAGLIATVGPQIDPGFSGCLSIGLTNISSKPVILDFAEDFISVEFHRLKQAVKTPYCGVYQGQMGLTKAERMRILEGNRMSLTDSQSQLLALTASVQKVSEQQIAFSTQQSVSQKDLEELTADVRALTKVQQEMSREFSELRGKLEGLLKRKEHWFAYFALLVAIVLPNIDNLKKLFSS